MAREQNHRAMGSVSTCPVCFCHHYCGAQLLTPSRPRAVEAAVARAHKNVRDAAQRLARHATARAMVVPRATQAEPGAVQAAVARAHKNVRRAAQPLARLASR